MSRALENHTIFSHSKEYDNIQSTSWTVIECNVAIICACLPMFRALLTRLLPSLFPSSSSRSPHSYSHNLSSSYSGKNRKDWSPTTNSTTSKLSKQPPQEQYGNRDWHPSHSGKGFQHENHLANISAGRSRALASEEYILQGRASSDEEPRNARERERERDRDKSSKESSRHRPGRGSGSGSVAGSRSSKKGFDGDFLKGVGGGGGGGLGDLGSLKDEERERVVKGEGIKLTTTYGIKYDDEESVIDGGEMGKEVSFERGERH